MRTGEHRSYSQIDHWRKYQQFLPDRMRLGDGREPAEEWWPWRGADIHLDRYAVPEAPLTVILLHGVGGNGRLLAPLGLMLQEHGYEAVIPDLPGYGLSVVSPDQIALDRWVDCVADLAEAEARRTGRRVVLFGMSLGGMLGYMAAAQGRRAAGVIATTLLDLRLPIAREQGARTPVLARLLTRLLPPLAAVLGGLRLPIRWFTKMGKIANDPEVARLVCEDSVGGGSKVPLRFLRLAPGVQAGDRAGGLRPLPAAPRPPRGRPLDDDRGQSAILRPDPGAQGVGDAGELRPFPDRGAGRKPPGGERGRRVPGKTEQGGGRPSRPLHLGDAVLLLIPLFPALEEGLQSFEGDPIPAGVQLVPAGDVDYETERWPSLDRTHTTMPDRPHVCVFCGSSRGSRPAYTEAARRTGTALARHGLGVVYGGGRVGLMGVVADAALAEGDGSSASSPSLCGGRRSRTRA